MNYSRASKDNVELEQQFILRLPEQIAHEVRNAIANKTLGNRLGIKLNEDAGLGTVLFDQQLLHAKLVRFPTIIESSKTIDNVHLYKTADISEMLICQEEPFDEHESEDISQATNIVVDKRFKWPHGLTPPLKNVRKKRFRKYPASTYAYETDVEDELKRIFRSDMNAYTVKYEITDEIDEVSANTDVESTVEEGTEIGSSSNGFESEKYVQSTNSVLSEKMSQFNELRQEYERLYSEYSERIDAISKLDNLPLKKRLQEGLQQQRKKLQNKLIYLTELTAETSNK